jgi:hypothetical protein
MTDSIIAPAAGAGRELKTCDLPNCPNQFVPESRAHRFCSSTCKTRYSRYRHVLERR